MVGVGAETRHYPKAATGDAARPVIQENVASTHLTTRKTPLLSVAKVAGAAAAMVARGIVQGLVSEASPAPPQAAIAQLSFRRRQQAAVEVAMAAQLGQLALESSLSQLGRSGSERAREAVEVAAVLSEAVIGERAAVVAMVAVVGPSSEPPLRWQMRLTQRSKAHHCL